MALTAVGNGNGKHSTILQRIAVKDKSAVGECVDTYGSMIWTMARRLSNSQTEAEEAAGRIFLDIWRFAGRHERSGLSEFEFISLVARVHLGKHSSGVKQTI